MISGQVIAPLGGLGNVIIQVFDANGQPIGNALTDSTGFYLVGNVPAGTAVQVCIVTPSGYVPDAETKTATVAQQEVSAVDFYLAEEVVPSDTTPPTLDLPTDITAEATGPAGAVVTYAASAMDDVDGTLAPTCTPARRYHGQLLGDRSSRQHRDRQLYRHRRRYHAAHPYGPRQSHHRGDRPERGDRNLQRLCHRLG